MVNTNTPVGIRCSERIVAWLTHRPTVHSRPVDTHAISPYPHQETPSRQVQIHQPAGDEEPSGILPQPALADFRPLKDRLITKNTCSTLAPTFDLVRFLAHSPSFKGRWQEALACMKLWAWGAESHRVARCRRHRPTRGSPAHAAAGATPSCHAHAPPWPPRNESVWSGYPR